MHFHLPQRRFIRNSLRFLLMSGWRRIRPKRKKLPEIHKCISGSFFLFSLAWLVAYSNSWAERFIWLFLGTHSCILFFIFILFRIFVYLVKIFRAKMEPNILLKIYVIIMNSHIKNT